MRNFTLLLTLTVVAVGVGCQEKTVSEPSNPSPRQPLEVEQILDALPKQKESQKMRVSTELSSDQNVPFSDRVAAAKQKLRDEIKKAGLARIADNLDKLMMVSIRLKAAASDGVLKPGSSKLGGTPDLPEDMAWPECNGIPMALLAQFRMQDVAHYDPHGRLPKSGILYFFYEAREQKWGYDPSDRGYWRVIYYDGDLARLRPATSPKNLPKENRFRACEVKLCNEITLPSWESENIKQLKLSKDEWDRYVVFPGTSCGEGETIHRLLGHPEWIQGEMQLQCQLASNGIYVGNSAGYADPRRAILEKGTDDWQFLLQIDSDEGNMGTMWGDVGRVYFWIREQHLKKRDFNNVWLVLQCY
jgi:uncharacterized protein YwqG